MKKILIAYIPVLHDGYRELFEKSTGEVLTGKVYRDVDGNKEFPKNELWVLGSDFVDEFKEIKKDIRRLDAGLVAEAVEAWMVFDKVEVVGGEELRSRIKNENLELEYVMPNDDLMHRVAKKYFPEEKVKFEPVFLRWDKHNSLARKNPQPDGTISFAEFDQKIMKQAFAQASNSTDWWRHVGGVMVKDGEVVLMGFNKHLPTENSLYFYNDVRSLFSKGKYFELVSSIHAEAMMIAEAARRGIALDGTSIYVTTFPCSVCAKQIAQAGIKKLYYSGEYSMLDGEDVMKAVGVELIQVELNEEDMKEVKKLEEERSILRKYE